MGGAGATETDTLAGMGIGSYGGVETADRRSQACKTKELRSVITHATLPQQDSLCGAAHTGDRGTNVAVLKTPHVVVRLQGRDL